MTSTSTAPASQAGHTWHHAMKLRKHLLKQLEKVHSDGGIDLAQFEKIDGLLESLRLACVQTIFLDFEFAAEEKTESVLWTLHTSVNSEYRRALGKLKGNAHVVEKRKVDKMYQNFLRIAQKFYKGYVQRITARYDIPELHRIANGIEVQQPSTDDMISPVSEKLNRLVLRSCHATLIRLGDLARYRAQAKYKKSGGFDSALAYYALANDLIPESGFGHHQMGIIQLDEGNQLEVVYRFYRAWATAEPHPNAKSNLESKFKDLRAPNTSAPRQVSATPRDTFSMWFVRLHALFYKGEAFSQHTELEGEVIHRFDMLAKNLEAGDILLKAILINIAAFHVAGAKYAGSKKDSDLQFARFTMALNARFATVICDVLASELDKHARARKADPETFHNDLTPLLQQLLPVLRVYMIWLASRRNEIFTTPAATGGLIRNMLQSLSRVLTLLSAEATEHKGLESCPYLLLEDLEIRGFQPMEYDQVPEACRCFCNDAGDIKPRREDQVANPDVHKESLARLLDILRVGYFFAEDQYAPLSYHISDDTLFFEYSPNRPRPMAMSANASESNPPPESQPEITSDASQLMGGPVTAIQTMASAAPPALHPEEPTWSDFSVGDEVTNDQTENTVMSMLTPFLKPPTPQAAGHASATSETSYGLHSASAEDILETMAAQRSPGGTILPTTFEQLPWGWLHTPTPQKRRGTEVRTFSGDQRIRDDPHSVRSPDQMMQEHLQSPLADRATSDASQDRMSRPLGGPLSPSMEDPHRNQLLESFLGAGSAPRTSSFSHWSPDHQDSTSRQPSAASPWAQEANTSLALPMSSNISAFSHSSSLYQGTPNGIRPPGIAMPNPGSHGHPSGNSWQDSVLSERQRRVDNTTATYNAAIFHGVYQDWK